MIAAVGGTLAGLLLTTQVAGPLLAQQVKTKGSVYEQLDLFGTIFERIRKDYVKPVNDKKLIQAAINGMLTSLDPHSSYLPPKDFNSMQVQTRGEFGGLGIEVTQKDGFVKVISPMDGTPADKAGIKSGDFITRVNGKSLLGLNLNQAVDIMRGPVGSEAVLMIVRKGVKDPFDVKVVRATIKMTAVRSRLVGKTVVLRITTFNDQTYPNLVSGLKKSVKEAGGISKVDGFVIDLRNNPGGLLNQAIKVSDAFLDKGEIVSTRGRNPQDNERYNATPGDLAQGKPMVVLINGGSASASEIVSGALKDHHRAIVVGTKSFGKGSVQTIMPIKGDGAIRLTTARYYTPSGRSIQALGIQPDVEVKQPPVTAKPTGKAAKGVKFRSEADLRGSLANDTLTEDQKRQRAAEHKASAAAAKLRSEDFQLAYAVDLLRGLATIAKAN